MDSAFHNALAAGITGVMVGPGSANAVGGQFAFIKTDGRRVDDRVVLAPAAMKIAFGENPKVSYGMNGNIPATKMCIRDRLEAAGVRSVSLTDFDAIAAVAAESGYIRREDVARLLRFRDNPADESWIGAAAEK